MFTATQALPKTTQSRLLSPINRLLQNLRALASLQPLSDAHLRDIGLTRADVQTLRDFPLSAEAATNLHIAATRLPGTW